MSQGLIRLWDTPRTTVLFYATKYQSMFIVLCVFLTLIGVVGSIRGEQVCFAG